jgi:hypothetical protein
MTPSAAILDYVKHHIDSREALLKGILDRLAQNPTDPGEFQANLVRLIQIDTTQGRLDELNLLRKVLSQP